MKTKTKASHHIEKIAKEILGIETLETRKSDRRDFHEVAVWEIRDALEAAYSAGQQAGKSKRESGSKSFRLPNGRGGFVTVTFIEE